MHVIFRTLWVLLKARRRSAISAWETASLPLRAQLTDVDLLLHINNGQYFSLFDLGRYDLMARSGLWQAFRQQRWHAVVQAEQITFRKSVTLGKAFEVRSRIIGVDERCFYVEHHCVIEEEIYVRAVVAGRMVGEQGPVSIQEILRVAAEAGHPIPENFTVSEDLRHWRESSALPSTRRPALFGDHRFR